MARKHNRINRRKFIDSLKKECYICGKKENLTFHHLENWNKKFDIGQHGREYGLDILKKEIEKCIVLCRDCHDIVEGK